ncbi:hypothetical protein GCM10010521_38800 [Streptomyces rameus]|uniref:Activator of Hsp90 ATPase homologue 1/2-like C-terminal domain-containing protein n=1 Tax=Streptomyces rameus TaxID=68261 RepID=A0ABP6NGJ8_9ACTN
MRALAYDTERTLSLRWTDADPANPADRSVTRTLEQDGHGTRLFLVHEGFGPDGPARAMAHRIVGRGGQRHVLPARGQVLEQPG